MEKKSAKTEELPDPRAYAMKLLSRREYSVGQMRRKLKTKGYDPKLVNALLLNLIDGKYLDDNRFARMVVESMIRRKPAGRSYLVAHLRKKLVPRELAVEVVEEFLSKQDETEMAEQLLRTRWRYFSKFDVESSRRKAYNYLSRRSIGYQAAKNAYDKLMKENND